MTSVYTNKMWKMFFRIYFTLLVPIGMIVFCIGAYKHIKHNDDKIALSKYNELEFKKYIEKEKLKEEEYRNKIPSEDYAKMLAEAARTGVVPKQYKNIESKTNIDNFIESNIPRPNVRSSSKLMFILSSFFILSPIFVFIFSVVGKILKYWFRFIISD